MLIEPQVWRKLAVLDETLSRSIRGEQGEIPLIPGRDVQILSMRGLPSKPGLASREGQARLLHDLASIELQAMELGMRTLYEFPNAPAAFREQLAEVTRDEGRHLKLCLEGLENLGLPWGSFPTHVALWAATSTEDSLLDRIVIVHRYLEGSGLDATNTILRRLTGVNAPEVKRTVTVISDDEVKHVQFGSRWYHQLLREQGVDPTLDFRQRLERLMVRVPRRLEPIHLELRKQAGFLPGEIEFLQELRSNQSSHPGRGSAIVPRPAFPT